MFKTQAAERHSNVHSRIPTVPSSGPRIHLTGYRVVHLYHLQRSTHTNVESQLHELAQEQARRGNSVTVVNVLDDDRFPLTESLRDDGAVRVIWCRPAVNHRWPDVDQILHDIRDVDVVHVHGTLVSPIFRLVGRKGRRQQRRLVASVYAPDLEAPHKSVLGNGWVGMNARRIARRYGYIAVTGRDGSVMENAWRRLGVGLIEIGSRPVSEVVSDLHEIYGSVIGERTRTILGARIKVTDDRRMVRTLDEFVTTRTPARIAFVNANLACISAKDPQVSQLLAGFTLLNDGVGIEIASRLLYGSAFTQNLCGTDFVPHYLAQSSHGLRVFLLGARPAVLEKVRKEFERRWPQHQVVGSHHGYFSEDEAQTVRDRVSESRPDIVFVAMGNPRQEMWAAENVPAVAPIAICVGALFDFLAGEVSRAPRWIRRMRIEWAFRLSQEPARLWRRYTIEGFSFIRRIMQQYWSGARA